MKIDIALDPKSIKEAIKKLKSVKYLMPKMVQEFTEEVAKWITNRANDYIKNSDLGSLVKAEIMGGWNYEPIVGGIKVVNRAEKAVYVEFGVGIVGQSQAHPEASKEGYEYNVKSRAKFLGGSWSFRGKTGTLDLPMDSVEYAGIGEQLVFITQGAKGVWYAYNAIVDAQMEIAKVNGGAIGKLWNDIKKRYIG